MKASGKSFALLYLVITFIVLTSYINPYLFSQTDKSLNSLYEKFLEIKNSPVAKHSNFTSDNKCGFEIVNTIKINFEYFSAEQQAVLKPLLQRPVTATSFVTPGGFFRVHYDSTGPNAPGYDLNLLAEALDSTYKFEIDFLGYDIPPGDSATNPNIPPEEYGGDNRYDVYIGNLGSGIYGYTRIEYEVEVGSNRYTSYMMIDNDFTNYFSSGINGARITVAHEFHHSIQGGNYIFRPEDAFFYEITSTAMEEFVFDDVNDYYAYIPSYFSNPETPLPLANGFSTATWNIYLRDNFGYDIIKRQWELMPSVRAMFAINTSILEHGSSFAREFNRYGIWMYFTNYRAVPGKYFEEGVNYPLVEPTSVVQFTPPSQTLNMSSRAAAHSFITFVISGNNDSLVTIVSNGDVQNAVSGLNNFFDFQYSLFNYQEPGSTPIMNNYYYIFESQYEEHFKIVHILNDLIATSVTDDDVITQYKLYQNYPNPFNPSTQITYKLAQNSNVVLKVYNLLGKEVVFLVDEQKEAGIHKVNFDASNLPSGVYLYKIEFAGLIKTKKMMLMK